MCDLTVGKELRKAVVQAGQLCGECVQDGSQHDAVRLRRALISAPGEKYLHKVEQQPDAGALDGGRQGVVVHVPATTYPLHPQDPVGSIALEFRTVP